MLCNNNVLTPNCRYFESALTQGITGYIFHNIMGSIFIIKITFVCQNILFQGHASDVRKIFQVHTLCILILRLPKLKNAFVHP